MWYVTDLDGTLLDRKGQLSPISRKRLVGLLSDDLPFTVASARSWMSIREILGDLNITKPIIECNGAFVSDYATGKKWAIQSIPHQTATYVHDAIQAEGLLSFATTYDGENDHLYYGQVSNPGLEAFLEDRRKANDGRLRETSDWDHVFKEEVICLSLAGQRGPLEAMRQRLSFYFRTKLAMYLWEDYYLQDQYWLMIQDARACKGRALEWVMGQMVTDKIPVTVFGDQVNDLGMFKMADRRVAVANACEALKANADTIIGHHADDSVTEFILEDWQSLQPLV